MKRGTSLDMFGCEGSLVMICLEQCSGRVRRKANGTAVVAAKLRQLLNNETVGCGYDLLSKSRGRISVKLAGFSDPLLFFGIADVGRDGPCRRMTS